MIGGSLTHYETAGTGKLPIVLLHGFGWWSFTWRPLLAALGADARFTAFAPDMRGFGFTERPRDALYNIDGYVEHVIEFIAGLQLDRPVLVGNSLGGEVALRVAAERPDLVRGLVLLDATAYTDPSPLSQALPRLLFIPPFNRTVMRAVISRPAFVRANLERRYYNPSSVNLSEIVANLRKPFDQRGAEDAFIAMIRTRRPAMAAAIVRRVKAPTLIMWGENDAVVPVAVGRHLQSDIAGSRLVVYPRTGHAPQEEARERVAADLIAFCEPLASPA
jgi:pimeloyl-ACP methyl ester carboxylesterase